MCALNEVKGIGLNMDIKEIKNNFFNKYDLSTIRSESDVEIKVVLPILNLIGYENNDIIMRCPVTFNQGRQIITKEADMVLKKNGKNYIVIENKNPYEKIDDEVVAQLDSYAFGLSCKYGVICNGKNLIIRNYLDGNQKEEIYRSTIPELDFETLFVLIGKEDKIFDLAVNKIMEHSVQKQAKDFSTTLKRIHKNIRDIDKLDPTGAFDGWSKLLFMKIYEEKWTEKTGIIRFDYKTFIAQKKLDKAESFINDTFMETKKAFPKIFEDVNESIGLSIEAIEKILEELDGQKLLDIPYDVKGQAFEIFLSSTFRGKGLGQFFTPRPVVNMMVNLVNPSINERFLDPACGTGGFLIRVYNDIVKKVNNLTKSELNNMHKTKEELIEQIKENNFFGIDAEPRAAKTAKMNMIMWGDGENVYRGNGLDNWSKKGEKYPFGREDISLILANPPFGATEKDENILSNYSLYMDSKITKTECLFVERAINCLSAGGKLAIVLPDAILGSQSLVNVRELIKEKTIIKAIVSLPNHTFSVSGVQTINSSVVYLEKKSKANMNDNSYSIFMAVAQNIGYDPTGRPTVKNNQKTDLDLIVESYNNYLNGKYNIDSDYFEIDNNSFVINSSLIKDRIDSRYYWFNHELNKRNFTRVPLSNYVEILNEKIDPIQFPDTTFDILTVSNKYGIMLDEEDPKKCNVPGEEFTQKYKVVHSGDIVYNPYRINVGSIGIVGEEYDGKLVSNAYVVFKTKNNLDPRVLLSLFKHPFYKVYIDVLATGSIRNNFSDKNLRDIYIPQSIIDFESETLKTKFTKIDELNKKIEQAKKELESEVTPFIN